MHSLERKNATPWFWLTSAKIMVTEGWPHKCPTWRVLPSCRCYNCFHLIKLRIDMHTQNKLFLNFLDYQGDGWQVLNDLMYAWMPEKNPLWCQHLSKKLSNFQLDMLGAAAQLRQSALKKDTGLNVISWEGCMPMHMLAPHWARNNETIEIKAASSNEWALTVHMRRIMLPLGCTM